MNCGKRIDACPFSSSSRSLFYFMAEPLRKVVDGVPYARPRDIDEQIDELHTLVGEERDRRMAILDPRNPEYVRSECLLHFLRGSRMDNSDQRFQSLYQLLIMRVRQALPGGRRRPNGPINTAEERAAAAAESRFIEMLVNDRNGYDDRLDFFEAKFAFAVKSLRRTALSKMYKEKGREAQLPEDADSIDAAHASSMGFNPINPDKYSDPIYRVRLRDAIHALPDDLRKVLILDMAGIPFTSKDPAIATIGSLVGCGEQTARQRRDRAYAALRIALQGKDDE